MNNFMVNWLQKMRFAGPVLLSCLAVLPTSAYATTIDISYEKLEITLQALDESFYFSGSAFEETNQTLNHAISSSTILPNACCGDVGPSYFTSMYWWSTSIRDNSFGFTGDANTDRYVQQGDYHPYDIVYASSIVSLELMFTVNGNGASLLPRWLNGSPSNGSLTIKDLTTGALFQGGDLLSGHDYYAFTSAQSINGGGDEQVFSLNFYGAHARVPEPETFAFLAVGVLAAGLSRRKSRAGTLRNR
ncbi:PEP-CTERM sorting domain-containing protein [Psychromonas ossibalaenae]|uniref:PEP-CTERM sorting domain-containing protein n=1 Tax=Psychromonas ossibalaenae TaxID=444922 RepID=UPI0003785745|nr:PEP-CTERM sorting domain-containing protein [Psychromonas ossibalaenae]